MRITCIKFFLIKLELSLILDKPKSNLCQFIFVSIQS
jgi:hypothetical protein